MKTAQWWFVARVKAGIMKNARDTAILFGEVPYSDEFFSLGEEIWVRKASDGSVLVAQPIEGGRLMRMSAEAAKRYIEPRKLKLPERIII